MKLITVHSTHYGNIYDVRINTDRIDYFQECHNTRDNKSIIYFSGHCIEVMESVEEIENLIYSIPKDMIRRTLEELKSASEYIKESDLRL